MNTPRHYAKVRPQALNTIHATTPYFNVKQLAQIYGFPVSTPLLTTNTVVGVLSFGGGLYGAPQGQATPFLVPAYTPSSTYDIQKYWAYLGYTAAQMPQVIIYPVGGAVNDLTDTGSTGENTLDVSIIGGCCPSARLTIVLFLCPNTYAFSQALPIALAGITFNAVSYVPTILSISWGSPEIGYLPSYTSELTQVATILQTATQNGVNICAAAGDNGSTDGNGTTALSVDFPASCPYVTAVGGTSLVCPSKTTYDINTSESVWNDGLLNGTFAATGGGVSAYYNKPAYQQNINPSTTKRNVPDIAFNADPATGLILYLNGQLQAGWGGTSMAAPLLAGYLALVKPTKFVNPLLYAAAPTTNFHDITTGNNYDTSVPTVTKMYSATAGYDCCTGLGSINGLNLQGVLAPVPVPAPPPPPPPVPPAPVLATSVTLNYSSLQLNLRTTKTFQLVATVLPSNTTNKVLRWVSSNPIIATVSSTGLVTLNNKGLVAIGAITTDGTNKYAIAYLTIKNNYLMRL